MKKAVGRVSARSDPHPSPVILAVRHNHIQSVFRICGNQEGPPEVAAGSVGYEPDLDFGIPGSLFIHEAVDDFVEGPVPSHANDGLRAFRDGRRAN